MPVPIQKRLEPVTVSAKCLKVIGIVVFMVAVNVINIELALMGRNETACLAKVFSIFAVYTTPVLRPIIHSVSI